MNLTKTQHFKLLLDIDCLYGLVHDAQYELEEHDRCHIDGMYSDTAEIVAFIEDCKKRIKRLERLASSNDAEAFNEPKQITSN